MASELDLNHLPLFIAVVEAGSFTAAAERLGCTKTKISLSIRALEQRLGAALFTRTTRQITLTDAGQQLYLDSKPLLATLGERLQDVGSSARTLSGTLRITAPVDHMSLHLAKAAAAFGERHPKLSIELRSGDKTADLVREGIDVAIRMGWLKDSSLRAQKLGSFEQLLVASQSYLDSYGAPSHPRELAQHRWLEFTPLPSALTWTFSRQGETQQVQLHSRLKVDNTSALTSLIKAGAGISVIGHFGQPLDAQLIPLLSQWTLPKGGIYAVFPPGNFIPARVRAFVDFYRDWLAL
ncbi:LysR family transcriptional regulator [Gallaecimonas mangrovi]|uniref:LysR family transcriptional regulator n=1 Tax=Gallaecimonas mangrovi TaxID=2291597 RepID=UPI000E201E70|nr:LysR family transcriptional regulator [Gallaecimonas mangrovi]